jgi:deazaflavin-dependent oxidoreductase (nitroreductase family)
MGELIASRSGWIGEHLKLYLESGGRQGHFVDVRDMGGYEFTATLLLKTIGRKSGRSSIVPLLYGLYGDELIIAASNGGADDHPGWYLNLERQEELRFQIVEDRFRGGWRLLAGAERTRVWDYLVGLYPPYADYQRATARKIPVIALKRESRVDSL